MKNFILIGSTNECNCDCFYCPVIKAEKPKGASVLTTDEHKDLIKQIAEISQPKKNPGTAIGYIGGEPLIREDAPELIKFARKKGFFTSILTNGILIDEKMVKVLKKSKLGFATITIDAISPEEFDELKGKGSYNKVINAVKLLKKHKIPVIWSTHFSKQSVESGEQIKNVKKALELNVDSYNLFEFLNIQNEKKDDGSVTYKVDGVSDKTMKEFYTQIKPYIDIKSPTVPKVPEDGKSISLLSFLFNTYEKASWINFENGYTYNSELDTLVGNCLCMPKIQYSISWFGDVQPCVGNKFSFGNVKEKPLKEILDYMWNHEMFDFRKEKNEMLIHNKYNFAIPKGCFSKYEAALINNVPKYYELFKNASGYPIRIDRLVD